MPKSEHIIDLAELIIEEIRKLPTETHHPCIFKIPKTLRDVNPKAYTPYRLAIGPYHVDTKQWKSMENDKLKHLVSLMSRKRDEIELNNYIKAIKERESEAWECYSEIEDLRNQLGPEKFQRMLLLDGAFILELFCRVIETNVHNGNLDEELWGFISVGTSYVGDPLYSNMRTMFEVQRDLMLLENQLPYFILEVLFHCTFSSKNPSITLAELVYLCMIEFIPIQPNKGLSPEVNRRSDQVKVKHLVHLMRLWCLDAPEENPSNTLSTRSCSTDVQRENPSNRGPTLPQIIDVSRENNIPQSNEVLTESTNSIRATLSDHVNSPRESPSNTVFNPCCSLLMKYCCCDLHKPCICLKERGKILELQSCWPRQKKQQDDQFRYCIPATDLHEAGIRFKSINKKSIHIKFDEARGVVEMPHLTLDEFTETFFRNIMAFEIYHLDEFEVTNYMYFMDGLIDTTKDVHILEDSHLIDNWLESKENVATIFNNITKHTCTDYRAYEPLANELTAFTKKPWNKWKAMLRRDYFDSPWAIISVVAAAVLLGLTVVQTIAAVRSTKWH